MLLDICNPKNISANPATLTIFSNQNKTSLPRSQQSSILWHELQYVCILFSRIVLPMSVLHAPLHVTFFTGRADLPLQLFFINEYTLAAFLFFLYRIFTIVSIGQLSIILQQLFFTVTTQFHSEYKADSLHAPRSI